MSSMLSAGATPYSYWLMSPGAEQAMGCVALSTTVMTMVWKSVGLTWIPFGIGKAWDSIYVPQPGYEVAQYPRRTENEHFWNTYYFVMYGVWGTYAQYSSYRIAAKTAAPLTKDAVAPGWMITAGRHLGAFHAYMFLHHGLWAALSPNFGKFLVSKWKIPCPMAQTAALCVWIGFHGAKLVATSKGKTTAAEIRRRTTMINTTTIIVGSVAAGFLIENLLGVRSATFEYVIEELIIGGPLLMLAIDAVKCGCF